MGNPFEDDGRPYVVLKNAENQHSLWPCWIKVPVGWSAVFGPAARSACVEFVDASWLDMRCLSLAKAMAGDDGNGG